MEISSDALHIHSISEILDLVQSDLNEYYAGVWLSGEISNLKLYPSGHTYLTLKDENAQIRGVLFKGVRRHVPFQIETGMAVLVYGRLSLYQPRGDLQVIIENMEPMGLGALQLAFEQLKTKLKSEGLFEKSRKKPLPFFPRGIGVITSQAGAALHDILHVLERRCPAIPIKIYPVTVQGDTAPAEIQRALKSLDPREDIDVILLARGGGSIEDLWAFNDEQVARTLSQCQTPVITGVGHETDFTIADFVADCRAPTPSAAAEMAVPVQSDLLQNLMTLERRMNESMMGRVQYAEERLQWLKTRLTDPSQRLHNYRLRLTATHTALQHFIQQQWDIQHARLRECGLKLESANPLAILKRGYCIATSKETQTPLKSDKDIMVGDTLNLRLHQGTLKTRVTKKIDSPNP
jgi:exodeoxyribonuclease VII large subunit